MSNLSSSIILVSIVASMKSYSLETEILSICLTTLLSLFKEYFSPFKSFKILSTSLKSFLSKSSGRISFVFLILKILPALTLYIRLKWLSLKIADEFFI